MASRHSISLLSLLLCLVAFLPSIAFAAKTPSGAEYITYQSNDGETVYLADDRRPSLYTRDFGDCLGNSLVHVTSFDASYYADNMTVTFDIRGTTNLTRDSLMIYIGVFAYGESRFELPFDPCKANIYSMCPAQRNVSINAGGQIPLAQADVANIPSIALNIPDFEGQAVLRIFSNTTQSEIACYSALVTNGSTFSQPKSVGSILGIFTVIAIAASFMTAIYGETVTTMRKHYAHSLSVLVVFAVFQHIFFAGALSMNWPSVLVAFWSNYAWAGGMIYTDGMQDSIDRLTRGHRGNTSALGAAGAGTYASSVGGGFDLKSIYKRSRMLDPEGVKAGFQNMLAKRVTVDSASNNASTVASKWFGVPVRDGLPLPGNYSGFAGTLYPENIPASNAFLTSLIWFVILLVIVAGSVVGFKFILEALYKCKVVKTPRLAFFRSHWKQYTALALLRTCFIGFFAMIFLTIFQFTYGGAASVLALAAIVFALFFAGVIGIAVYALWFRLRVGKTLTEPDRIYLERKKVLKVIPFYCFHRASKEQQADKVYAGSLPWWKITHVTDSPTSVHDDEEYIKKFGWLASRFRRTKWWFFAAWLGYEFVRAAFTAGASGHPMVQVFALLIIEFFAFMAVIKMRPFEGQRLNVIVVYLLGFSKVATVALSAAFDVSFNLARIPTTAIGIVIIVIQGLLTIAVLICIILSAISTYFSITRHREAIKPRRWIPYRERYFNHLDQAVSDLPPLPPPPPPAYEGPKDPYFSVTSVKRHPKIEDEDPEFMAEIASDPRLSRNSLLNLSGPISLAGEVTNPRASRAMSMSSRMSQSSLPYGARVHRGSWSTRDFGEYVDGGGYDRRAMGNGNNSAPILVDEHGAVIPPLPVRSASGPGLQHRDSRESVAQSRLSIPVSLPQDDDATTFKSAPSSPIISRNTSHADLAELRSANASPASSNLLQRPETPHIQRTPSPLHVVTNRSPQSVGSGGEGPPSPRSPGSPRSPHRPRSRLVKQKHGEIIEERGE
ncbi:TRP-domain-containing protein [Tothia fuscella]|uniref:TRP-domain-containing protein n=1 Tax=Tothia fuscella TaxID=1048955 RepID=A0A9P4NLK4_9PEZI|nr:TRP-domain-containing protein [Tothia fuscella]